MEEALFLARVHVSEVHVGVGRSRALTLWFDVFAREWMIERDLQQVIELMESRVVKCSIGRRSQQGEILKGIGRM